MFNIFLDVVFSIVTPFLPPMISSRSKNCILYCRVSTAKSAQEGESLDTQANILRKFATDKDLAYPPKWESFPRNLQRAEG